MFTLPSWQLTIVVRNIRTPPHSSALTESGSSVRGWLKCIVIIRREKRGIGVEAGGIRSVKTHFGSSPDPP